jgi:hypothetical protein
VIGRASDREIGWLVVGWGKVLSHTHRDLNDPKKLLEEFDKKRRQFRSREPSRHRARAFFIDVSTKSNVLRRMNCDKR